MVVDLAVSKRKFEREIGLLLTQQAVLQSRGIFLVGTPVFPIVEVLFVPRKPLRIVVPNPAISPPPEAPPGAVAAVISEIPNLAPRAFKARFDLSDYDLRAPSLEFRDPWTDETLVYETMFRAFEYEKDRQAHVVLLGDHPITHKPFLCLRGVREYHEHPQHSGDDWLLYREGMNLFSIVMNVWRAALDLARPMVAIQSNGFQIQWTAEAKE